MRAVVLSLLVASALFVSGCLGGEDDVENGSNVPVTLNETLTGSLQSAAAGTWVEPGTSIDVSVTPPADAVGNVTYTWLIQEDPFTIFTQSPAIDTGSLASGESADLVFDAPGFYEFGHCDPHPWMKHTVAVVEGYESAEHVEVLIVEGDLQDNSTWGFVPSHITIAPGTTVTYTNLGMIDHTASIAHAGEAVPVPRLLDLKEASGTVTVEGGDWMNIVAIMEDEAGNVGYVKEKVYVREKFSTPPKVDEGEFDAAWPAELGEPPAPELAPRDVHEHDFAWSGRVTLNVTVDDPTETLNQIHVAFRETESDAVPEPQVLMTSGATNGGTFTADIKTKIPLKYEVVVTPAQGAMITYSIEVTIAYDHTPPELIQLPCPEPHYSMGHC